MSNKNNIENLKSIKDERVQKIISEVESDGGKILFCFLRGSHCHGLNTETSDEDYGLYYASKIDNILNLGFNYKEQYDDDKNDVYCHEISKAAKLMIKANPTALESLFVDDEFILYEHPVITELKKHKYSYLTKKCYKPFYGYSKSQLIKGKSQNKAVMKPILKPKKVIDFCMCPWKQGSCHFETWLAYRGLKQDYCGLVSAPNMQFVFPVFYDWGNHFLHENITADDLIEWYENDKEYDIINIFKNLEAAKQAEDDEKIAKYEALMTEAKQPALARYIVENFISKNEQDKDAAIREFYDINKNKLLGYKGICGENSQELRMSSVEKGAVPINWIHYDFDKYSTFCKEYREQNEWIKNRNPERFRQNMENMQKFTERKSEKGFYDSKNFCEMMRLLTMWVEIVRDGEYRVNRKNIDRDYLLQIKRGELTYNEIMTKAQELVKESEKYTPTCSLPDEPDVEYLNNWLINVRMMQIRGEI